MNIILFFVNDFPVNVAKAVLIKLYWLEHSGSIQYFILVLTRRFGLHGLGPGKSAKTINPYN